MCAVDHGRIKINEKGILACRNETHIGKIITWKFDCGDRTPGGKHFYQNYQYADYEGFTHAMAMALPHMKEAGAEWVKSLIDAISDQFGK